jgi:SAM-dependent methyltransferase
MGYVFDFKEASAYCQWSSRAVGQKVCALQGQLMRDLLSPLRGERVLAIGCGPGQGLQTLVEMGLGVAAIDPSPYMIDIARDRVGHRVDFYRGFAEDLPFDDNSFEHACLVNTMEFASDPIKALAEACRVARERIFVGVLNRWALRGLQRRVEGIFKSTIFNRAAFFSVWEVKKMLTELLGGVPITWRTVDHLPGATGSWAVGLERSRWVQQMPFGTFAGLAATLMPRFRSDPLAVVTQANHRVRPATG